MMHKVVRVLLGLVALAIVLGVALMMGLPRQEALLIILGSAALVIIASVLGNMRRDD